MNQSLGKKKTQINLSMDLFQTICVLQHGSFKQCKYSLRSSLLIAISSFFHTPQKKMQIKSKICSMILNVKIHDSLVRRISYIKFNFANARKHASKSQYLCRCDSKSRQKQTVSNSQNHNTLQLSRNFNHLASTHNYGTS